MIDGDGCDDGGGHIGSDFAGGSGSVGDADYFRGTGGISPIPNIKRLTINGAPVIESSHEYVLRRQPDNPVHNSS